MKELDRYVENGQINVYDEKDELYYFMLDKNKMVRYLFYITDFYFSLDDIEKVIGESYQESNSWIGFPEGVCVCPQTGKMKDELFINVYGMVLLLLKKIGNYKALDTLITWASYYFNGIKLEMAIEWDMKKRKEAEQNKLDQYFEKKTQIVNERVKRNLETSYSYYDGLQRWKEFEDVESMKEVYREKEDSFGYVYVAEVGQKVKIGMTKSPYNRIKQLESYYSRYFSIDIGRVLVSIPHTNFRSNERKLHKLFENSRINGSELFDITYDSIKGNLMEKEDTLVFELNNDELYGDNGFGKALASYTLGLKNLTEN